ncbi:MipA/OmpV family protein [Rhodoferax saidenbachensis]|uniref:Outer membrane scaffolding protein for murein synthesis (MipA/OmpV family) n=1 Tax=Rhodoferax saidenbachensis TaxID=1484693 RepID=A0ABU1ZPG5_9BURK|nr:MipA/OmpV family protein [Rhodoferax saidenbachensis]MDR7307445.1 outer membrane scaffolding protein for murein synthesis (MipA/OmpV family) [Rhodoferax saidenbachensis]
MAVRTVWVLLGSCVALAAHAQEQGLPLWEVGMFAGGFSSPAYPASSERSTRALVLPTLIYRGEVFRSDRGGVGARVLHTEDTELDIGFAASLPASSQDIPARQGMPDLGTLIEFGPRLKGTLARPTPDSQLRYELPLRMVLEINSGVHNQGFAMEPELSYDVRSGSWRLSTSASLVLGDSRLNQYFYGVPADLATAQRPAYTAQAGLISTRLTLNASRNLGPDVRVFAYVRMERYAGSANAASPLYQQSTGTSAGLGLLWTLGRSAAKVAH